FGYFYGASPVIAYDGAAHPVYSMGSFVSSSVPGCRAPHFWLSDKRSLYDALGDSYGLIRFDRDVAVDGLVAAAKRRGVPFKVLHVDDAEAAALYAKKLVLVRPDRHVAWRADVEPDDPLVLINLIRGVPAMISRERVLATRVLRIVHGCRLFQSGLFPQSRRGDRQAAISRAGGRGAVPDPRPDLDHDDGGDGRSRLERQRDVQHAPGRRQHRRGPMVDAGHRPHARKSHAINGRTGSQGVARHC